MPNTQFDLEQQIFTAWHVVDDIRLVRKILMDNNDPNSADNVLLGMEVKYQYAFDELFSLFEQLLKEKANLS